MPTQAAMKNVLANAYGAAAAYLAAYRTAPGASQGTEPTGGSPAYVRVLLSWVGATGGVNSAAGTLNIPAGGDIVAVGVHSASTGGTYYDGTSITATPFPAQGTLASTVSSTIL